MPTELETCENCGRSIGQLEQVYVWDENAVCAECYRRLVGKAAEPERIDPEPEKRPRIERAASESLMPVAPKSSDASHKATAVAAIRTWHLTICHDLCLPYVPVIARGQHPNGLSGQAFYNWHQNATGFVGINYNGLFLGGPVGGEVSETYRVEIYAAPQFGEREYVWILAHELRRIWQYLNRIAPTEEDCSAYAERFMTRYSAPTCGPNPYLIDECDWVREAENSHRKRRPLLGMLLVFGLPLALFIFILLICGGLPRFLFGQK